MATKSTRVEVKERRVFPVDEKRRIVGEYRAAVSSLQRGEVLRREGIYQSHVWKWGQQIDDGTLGTRRHGPEPTGKDPRQDPCQGVARAARPGESEDRHARGVGHRPGKMLGAARRRTHRRQRQLPEDVIGDVSVWIPKVGLELACRAFGVAPRTWRHHQQQTRGELPRRPSRSTGIARRPHPAKLSPVEEATVLGVLCEERFVDVGVAEIYATLLDEGTYLCSQATMHRILRDHQLAGQRRQRQPGEHHTKPRVVATAPNVVWVWDISRLPGPVRGVWFYLYVIWDLWSRKAVGWCVHATETAAVAERLITVTATANASNVIN